MSRLKPRPTTHESGPTSRVARERLLGLNRQQRCPPEGGRYKIKKEQSWWHWLLALPWSGQRGGYKINLWRAYHIRRAGKLAAVTFSGIFSMLGVSV
jgi:hypothetical protein